MTSSESMYSLTAATPAQESLFVGDKWRYFAESALQPAQRTHARAAVVGLVLGTGAVAPFSPSVTNSAPAIIISCQPPKMQRKLEVRSAAEQIIAIRSLLGLNVMELAAILHVQRPTIYSWQSGMATPHSENGNRLRYIYELAQRWSRICTEPIGGWVRKPLDPSGRTLASLLSLEVIDEQAINHAFAGLKARLEEDAKSFISVRERARRFGYKDRSGSKLDSSLDRETFV